MTDDPGLRDTLLCPPEGFQMPCMVTETSLMRKPMPPRMATPKKQTLTLSQKVLQSGLDRVLKRREAERKKPIRPMATLLSEVAALISFTPRKGPSR